MTFAAPSVFWLLVPLLLVLVWRKARFIRPALGFSSLAIVGRAGGSWRQRLISLPLVLRVLALLLIITGLARPQQGLEKVRDIRQGVAIEMVVDRSSSMAAEMELDNQRLNRLVVVKQVVGEFINGNGRSLSGRHSDLVGMVSFARYADTICPLTLAHNALGGLLDNLQLVEEKSEDGTAIGDGLMLAAARLKTAEETLASQVEDQRKYAIKSKIIILLTDGQNNAGEASPEDAAALAGKWGIKIYTIGVGGDQGGGSFFGIRIPRSAPVDKQLLKELAESTGGLFRMAEDGDALRQIYDEIDKLEKSELERLRHVDYREYFWPFVLAAFVLLGLEIILSNTVLRRLP